MAGDGDVPLSALPYEVVRGGIFLQINRDIVPSGTKRLRWSTIRDVLIGLREFMVLQGHPFEVRCEIIWEAVGHVGSVLVLNTAAISFHSTGGAGNSL